MATIGNSVFFSTMIQRLLISPIIYVSKSPKRSSGITRNINSNSHESLDCHLCVLIPDKLLLIELINVSYSGSLDCFINVILNPIKTSYFSAKFIVLFSTLYCTFSRKFPVQEM